MAKIQDILNGLNQSEQLLARRSVSISVDLNAVRHNLATSRRLTSGARQFATIKADAYGHGAVPIAHALSASSCGQIEGDEHYLGEKPDYFADGFAVVTLDEALELRRSGILEPILVLQGPRTSDACKEMLHYGLWPVIHDLSQYEFFAKSDASKGITAWLKVDSGMGRLGVTVDQATRILSSDNGINWMGLMTHFASADETSNSYTLDQYHRFNQVATKPGMLKSLANSAAVLAWPQVHEDWVRPGIMLYGCNPLDRDLPEGVLLKPAMCVEAPLIAVKMLPSGSGVGYAQNYRCPEDMPVGYVGLGYRDGLPRVLDNTATVMLNGRSCPIIGRVSMDSIAIDLRTAGQVAPGSLVEFWGNSASIDALSRAAGTISYELLTSIRGCRRYNLD